MEAKVLSILEEDWHFLIPNPNKKWMDLLIIEKGIEVKYDEYAQYSWNFYIEFECNWKPSGIYKNDGIKLKYWCHSDGNKVFLLDGKKLQQYVEEKIIECRANKSWTSKGFKVIENWWNWWRTKGLLVPVKEIEKQAKKIYHIKNN